MPNNKHLDFPDRVRIEEGLNSNLKIRAIANFLDKHPSTITKEIKLHRYKHRSRSLRFNYNACAHRYDCTRKNVCAEQKTAMLSHSGLKLHYLKFILPGQQIQTGSIIERSVNPEKKTTLKADVRISLPTILI